MTERSHVPHGMLLFSFIVLWCHYSNHRNLVWLKPRDAVSTSLKKIWSSAVLCNTPWDSSREKIEGLNPWTSFYVAPCHVKQDHHIQIPNKSWKFKTWDIPGNATETVQGGGIGHFSAMAHWAKWTALVLMQNFYYTVTELKKLIKYHLSLLLFFIISLGDVTQGSHTHTDRVFASSAETMFLSPSKHAVIWW